VNGVAGTDASGFEIHLAVHCGDGTDGGSGGPGFNQGAAPFAMANSPGKNAEDKAKGNVSAALFKITSESLSFDSQAILQDNGQGAYSSTQWLDSNASGKDDRTGTIKGNPLSYVRSTQDHDSTITIDGIFGIGAPQGQNLLPGTYSIVGYGNGPSDLAWYGDGSVVNGKLEAHMTSGLLPDTISKSDLAINWNITYTGQDGKLDTETAPTTTDTLYVNGSTASDSQYETVLDVGCRNANGLRPDPSSAANPDNLGVLNAIWKDFSTKQIVDVQGNKMSYWNPAPRVPLDDSVGFLLANHHGACGSWTRFLRDVLKAQGLAAQVRAVSPPLVTKGVLTTPRQVQATDIAVVPAPAQGDPTSNYVNGNPDMKFGNSNVPASWFSNHALIETPVDASRVFDPSYGNEEPADATKGLTAEVVWEQKHLMGWKYPPPDQPDWRVATGTLNTSTQADWRNAE
jgi:hypothetical protein